MYNEIKLKLNKSQASISVSSDSNISQREIKGERNVLNELLNAEEKTKVFIFLSNKVWRWNFKQKNWLDQDTFTKTEIVSFNKNKPVRLLIYVAI